MPAATPEPTRLRIWQAAQQGQEAAAIAQALTMPVRTVRHLLQQFRPAGLPGPPRFGRSGRRPCPAFAALRSQALQLRHQHPLWGAERILAHLFPGGRPPGGPDPGTVRRWLAKAGLAPAPRPRPPRAAPVPLARAAHEIWPMDACDYKPLRGGRRVCWLRLLDEASGAALFTRVYDQPRWNAVGGAAVQAGLRQAFARWGRPKGLRVDNGNPWIRPGGDLPTDLELWLAGLGVALHRGRPGVPQDNPRAERGQRTAQDWAEPGQHDTADQLQRRLDEEDRVHREVYLFDGKRTRLQAYPELRLGGRPYSPGRGWEDVCWDHRQALELLGRLELVRQVDKGGCVSLYDHRVPAGMHLCGQEVVVRFDAAGLEWVICQAEVQVRRCQAANLGAENVRALQVGRRPGRSAERTRKRGAARAATAPGRAEASMSAPARAAGGG